jgi:hypothetical protein
MKLNLWKTSTLVLAGALALVVGRDAMIASAEAGHQPHMRQALDALEKAKHALEKATADKGGHRVKAIELTESAIAEVKLGIEYDKEHKDEVKENKEKAAEKAP